MHSNNWIKRNPREGAKSISWPWLIFIHHILRQVKCDNSLWGHIQTHAPRRSLTCTKAKHTKSKAFEQHYCAFPNVSAISQTFRSHRDAEARILPTLHTRSFPSKGSHQSVCSLKRWGSQIVSHLFSSEDLLKVKEVFNECWTLGRLLSKFAPTDLFIHVDNYL